MTASPTSHRWIVDSIEERTASIETDGGKMIQLPVAFLPPGAKDGDVLRVTIEADPGATKQALAESSARVKKIRDTSAKRDPGGDITL